jgi:hypothetical protein
VATTLRAAIREMGVISSPRVALSLAAQGVSRPSSSIVRRRARACLAKQGLLLLRSRDPPSPSTNKGPGLFLGRDPPPGGRGLVLLGLTAGDARILTKALTDKEDAQAITEPEHPGLPTRHVRLSRDWASSTLHRRMVVLVARARRERLPHHQVDR